MIFRHPSRRVLPRDTLRQRASVVECEVVLGCFTQRSGINGVVHVGMIMKWGLIAVRCKYGVHKSEKKVRIALGHLVTAVQKISQFKLCV